METLSTKTLADYIAALAAPSPVPAGGSAAAVAVAQGIALVAMARSVSARKTAMDQAAQSMTAMAARMQGQANAALSLATADSRAFAAWLAAHRAASETPAAWQRTVEVPLQLCNICLDVLREVAEVASDLGATVAPDAWAGVQLIKTGADISLANVEANLRLAGSDDAVRALAAAARAYSSDLTQYWEVAVRALASQLGSGSE